MFDFLFSLAHRLFSPERAAASYVAPLARHVVVLNIGSHRSDVLELELGYIATSVEEEGLAVSTIVRSPIRNSFGSVCQNESVELGVGRVARSCFMIGTSIDGVQERGVERIAIES